MKNTKKNTGAKYHISTHTEIRSGKIIQKINEIGRKTYALKKKEKAFYDGTLKKARRSTEDFPGTDKLREMAYDRFEQEWKEIEDGKDEVNWMIHSLYISIEDEGEEK